MEIHNRDTHSVGSADLQALQTRIRELEEANRTANLRAYKAEQRLHLIEDILCHSDAQIFAFDRQGNFVYANPLDNAATALNLRAEQIIGKTWYDLNLAPEIINFWEALRDSVFEKGDRSAGVTSISEPYGLVYYDYTATPIRREDGLIVLGVCTFRSIAQQKQTQEKLREKERLLDSVINNTSAVIYAIDSDQRFILLNRRSKELLEYNGIQALGKTTYELFPKEVADAWTLINQQVIQTGQSIENEETAPHADGVHTYIAVKFPLYRPDGTIYGMGGISTDITERKRIEQQNQTLISLVENSSDFIGWADLNGQIQYCNPDGLKIVGLESPDGFRNTQLADYLTTEGQEILQNRVLPTVMRDGRWRGELIMQHFKTGELIPFYADVFLIKNHENGESRAIAFINIDLRERKQVESALEKSEAKFRQLTETLDTAIFLSRGNSILYSNPAAVAITGYSEQELRELSTLMLSHPDHREVIAKRIQARLQGEKVPSDVELKIVTKQGAIRWLLVKTITIEFEGHATALTSAVDITERKRTEEALRSSQEQLAQSQKMEAIGQLAGGIAHDFNNILTAIIGCSDILLDKLKGEDELSQEVDTIRASANRASSLTRQLLAFSRKQILQLEPTNINEVIGELDKMLARIIGENITIDLQLQTDLGDVMIDRGQLEQVILNLAVNARDAMPDGGALFIQTANFKVPAETQCPNNFEVVPGQHVRLTIRDTGVGMNEETQAHIFEPFFTTKGAGSGTGLGLATVYGIVNQSQGCVRVHSKLGEGTTFEIWLPLLPSKTKRRENVIPVRQAVLEGSETILLVEDDSVVRRLTRRILEKYKYTVLEAANGRQALAVSETYDGTIDLVITDMVMPEMSGQELIGKINQAQPNLKVIGISGYSDWHSTNHVNERYYSAFVQKPFTSVALVEKIREVLDTNKTEDKI